MNTLLFSPALGIFWLCFLFAFCFLFVHTARLAKIGREFQKQTIKKEREQEQLKQSEPTEKQTPPPQTQREPVYYIVEKKRRAKTSFSDPKEIRFK